MCLSYVRFGVCLYRGRFFFPLCSRFREMQVRELLLQSKQKSRGRKRTNREFMQVAPIGYCAPT